LQRPGCGCIMVLNLRRRGVLAKLWLLKPRGA